MPMFEKSEYFDAFKYALFLEVFLCIYSINRFIAIIYEPVQHL